MHGKFGPTVPIASRAVSGYIEATPSPAKSPMALTILIPAKQLQMADLEQFLNSPFEKMIKFVVDVRLEKIALGGEMQADAEEELIRGGSAQGDLWGGNLWPWERPPRIEYISLINIHPAADNRGMEIRLDHVRRAVRDVVREWVNLQ